jgi:hypothetical protein
MQKNATVWRERRGFGRLAGKNSEWIRMADLKIAHYKGLWQT